MSKSRDLTEGSVARALWIVCAPMSIGILGVLSVGIADSYFLARVGGAELAAIGFVYPVILTVTSLSIGLSAGTSAVVSQELGRSGADDAVSARLALHALCLGVGLAILAALLLWLGTGALFELLGAEGAVLEGARAYMPWWCLGFPFLVASQALNSVFKAGGESGIAAVSMLAQSALNVVLDPILIFGILFIPALGIEGAGLATACARILAFLGLLAFALRTGRLDLSACGFDGLAASVARIGRTGVPASLSNAINPLGMALVTSAVATLGDAAVGGFGAATRVQSLLFVPMLALSAGIGPVVGQAWGADREGRAQDAVRLTFLLCLGYGLALFAALYVSAPWVARVMTDGRDAVPYATQYLRWVSLGFFGYGVLITANAAMNARERALWSMGLSAGRIALVYVPLAWIGALTVGYSGIVAAAIAANVAAALVALVLCRHVGLLRAALTPMRAPG